jgi:hypothetical protein
MAESSGKIGVKVMSLFVLVILIFLIGGCAEKKNYDNFAKCLTESGVVMFGSELCSHCTAMKKAFGNAFRFIDNVECNGNIPGADPERCAAEGIEFLPTFKFGDGTKLIGELEFEILSQKTGCVLP